MDKAKHTVINLRSALLNGRSKVRNGHPAVRNGHPAVRNGRSEQWNEHFNRYAKDFPANYATFFERQEDYFLMNDGPFFGYVGRRNEAVQKKTEV